MGHRYPAVLGELPEASVQVWHNPGYGELISLTLNCVRYILIEAPGNCSSEIADATLRGPGKADQTRTGGLDPAYIS